MFKKKDANEAQIKVVDLKLATVPFYILGKTPLILNRQAEKARQELLFPSPQKNKAEKAQHLKTDPFASFRASPYINRDETRETLFHFPSGAFKKAIASAAVDVPGIAKAQVNRLCAVADVQVDLFGTPVMKVDMVRQAGTPAVRARCCLPEWACVVQLRFTASIIPLDSLSALFTAAGYLIGIGDFRGEKGAGDFGQFTLVEPNDPDWLRIVTTQDRAVQQAAYDNPQYYDQDTHDLMEWFADEVSRRRNERRPKTSGEIYTHSKKEDAHVIN